MKKLILTLAMTTLSLTAHAQDSKGGGGGAGVCKNNESCQTLTQTGFRVGENGTETRYEVDAQTMKELKTIDATFASLQLMPQWAVGPTDKIVPITEKEAKKAKRFKQAYREALTASGQTELAKTFELLAFSVGEKTYLVTERYSKLDVTGRALLLIHEDSIRRGSSVIDALRFDGALLDSLNAVRSGKSFDRYRLLNAYSKVSGRGGNERLA